jgi:hypothetical protein
MFPRRGFRNAIPLAAGLLAAACGGDSSGPSHGPAFRVTVVAGNAQTGPVATPLAGELVVKVTDVEGRLVPNAVVSWIVTGGGGTLAPVGASTKTNAEGRSAARWTLGPVAGGQVATAMVPNLPTTTFSATAVAGPPEYVDVAPQSATIVRGASQQFTAAVRDRHNNLVSSPPLTWSTSNTSVATAQASGLVTGGLAGEAITITASVAGKSGSATLNVVEPLPLVISTNELEEGRLTVPFTPALAATGGSVGHEWRVSGGQLPPGVSLMPSGRFAGTPMQMGVFAFDVTVRDAIGTESSRSLSLQVCEEPVNLAVGESFVWHFPHVCGVALPSVAGAAFRVGAVARSYQTSGATVTAVPGGIRLRASPRGAPVGAVVAATIETRHLGEDDAFDPATRRLMRTTEAVHVRLRDEEMRLYGFGPRLPLGPHDQMLAIRASQSVPPEQRTFFINNPAGGPRIQINATLRGSSNSILYYQDDAAVGSNDDATAAEVQAVLEYYELFGKSVIDNVFGGLGPLGTTNSFAGGPRLASDVDGNGRFIVVGLTDGHMLAGAAGYVTGCDRMPAPGNGNATPTCNGSNEAEITYILRPVTGFYLGTVVHEAKHIASLGYGRFAGRGFNPSWIEEGTADIAKELSSRNAMSANEGLLLRYADVFPGGAVTSASYGVSTVLSRARSFLRAAPLNGVIGDPNPNPNGSTYYGSSWLFHRFLADRYAAGNQTAFFRQMNTTGTGPQAIEQATGRSFADLLAEFAVAIAVDGTAAKQTSQHRFVSYDMAEIASRFAGGPWPYLRATGAYQAMTMDLPTYYSSPNFFEFASIGSPVLRIDLERMDGQPLLPVSDVAISIVRVR